MRRSSYTAIARDVARDEQGAILLLAVFMGVFMAGILFYAVGIGETVLYREGMQDAADSGALAAATTHARGMNLIVLINQIMAALLGILVVFRLIEMLATLAIGVCLAIAFFTGGGSTAAIPPLEVVRSGAHDAYTALDTPVHDALALLHTAETIVRDTIPALAEVSAVDAVVAHYSPPAAFGVAIPPSLTLPVENDDFGVLCKYAGNDAGDVVALPFTPLPGFVQDAVKGAVTDLAQTASAYFCGENGATAPTLTKKVTDKLPKLAARQQCEADASKAGAETDPSDDATASCLEVDDIETASKPDPDTGECTATDCGRGSPYEERLQDARVQCDPRATSGLTDFSWQERSVDVEYRYTSLGWKPDGVRRPGPFRVVTGSGGTHPCGDASARYSLDYQVDVHPSSSDDTVLPLCAEAPKILVGWARGSVQIVTITEVDEVFGCSHQKTITVPSNFGGAGEGTQGGSSQAPERVKSGAALGDENFQIRSVVFGQDPPSFADKLVTVAAWNASATSVIASTLGRLSAAQAEYFYDDQSPSSEWMWHRSWRARLKRLRAPEGDTSSDVSANFGGACAKAASGSDGGKSCSDAQQGLGQIFDLSSH
jgi:hypothetical protein